MHGQDRRVMPARQRHGASRPGRIAEHPPAAAGDAAGGVDHDRAFGVQRGPGQGQGLPGALDAERPVVIYPAGRIARRRRRVLSDPTWAASAVSLARRHHAPILPMHLAGPPSTLFRLFDQFSGELRDITLFHELLNKRGGDFRLTVGPLIAPGAIGDPAEMTPRLKAYVEQVLPVSPDQPFA